MSKTSFNAKPCSPGSTEEHNKRKEEYMQKAEAAGKLDRELFPDRIKLNECWENPDYAGRHLTDIQDGYVTQFQQHFGRSPILKDRTMVKKNPKTGKTYTKVVPGWAPLREACGPILPSTKIEDFRPFVVFLKGKGIRVIAIYLHRDEGKEDPVTGERKYNLHYHMVMDFFDPETKRTIKLKRDDLRDAETVLAEALGMERGIPKEQTHARHRSVAEQREYAAEKNLVRLTEQIGERTNESQKLWEEINERKNELQGLAVQIGEARSELQKINDHVKADARRSFEELRTNAMDVVARGLGLIGGGALASAREEEEKAKRERDEALEKAASEQEAREEAEKKYQEILSEKKSYHNLYWLMKKDREGYGEQCYADGYGAGRVAGLQEAEQSYSEELSNYKKSLENVRALSKFKNVIFPYLENAHDTYYDMKAVKIDDQRIKEIYVSGHLEGVTITFEDDYENSWTATVNVAIERSKDDKRVHVYFNGKRLREFKEDYIVNHRTISYSIHR